MRNKKEQSFLPLLKLPNKLGVKVSTYFNSNTKQSSPLLNLPNLPKELWEEILNYLTVYELVHSKEISKGFKGLIEENRTFKENLELAILAKAKRELGTSEYETYEKSLKEINESKNTVNENSNKPTKKEEIIDQKSNSIDLDTGEVKIKADEILLKLYKDPKEFSRVKKHIFERTKIETKQYEKCASKFAFLTFLVIFGTSFLAMYPLFYLA